MIYLVCMKNSIFNFRIDPETRKKLEELAKKQQRSMANTLKKLINEANE
jgi:predicted HicB family RNase H-like nuclease